MRLVSSAILLTHMANSDDFYQLLDPEKLNDYIRRNSKTSVRILVLLLGIVFGAIVPVLNLDSDFVKKGALVGLAIGFLWTAVRYKQSGSEGIAKTQKEVSVLFIYMVYFLLGVVGGHYLVRPVFEYFVSNFYPNLFH